MVWSYTVYICILNYMFLIRLPFLSALQKVKIFESETILTTQLPYLYCLYMLMSWHLGEAGSQEVLNVEGWVAAACYAGFFSLLVLLAVRGVRYLRRSNEEVQVHTALIEDDAEAVQEWSSWRWHQDSAWHCRHPVNSSARYHTAEQIHNQQNKLFQVAPVHKMYSIMCVCRCIIYMIV